MSPYCISVNLLSTHVCSARGGPGVHASAVWVVRPTAAILARSAAVSPGTAAVLLPHALLCRRKNVAGSIYLCCGGICSVWGGGIYTLGWLSGCCYGCCRNMLCGIIAQRLTLPRTCGVRVLGFGYTQVARSLVFTAGVSSVQLLLAVRAVGVGLGVSACDAVLHCTCLPRVHVRW